uniref:GIY-YIG domain-containing protein n=1 Tax=Orbilia brochopaga TaxID=3140254 RepID=A0A4Y5MZC7_9PEZI|nr:hypothetical protein [Drechslerella brochopaga]
MLNIFFKNVKQAYYSTSSAVSPEKFYSNSDTQKLQIISENKGRSGVYHWVNLENGKSYIGSSVNLGRRLQHYYSMGFLLLQVKKNKSMIYRALLKYGYSKFNLKILEYCEPDKCLEREQYYIDLIKPEYNILKIAGSSLGYVYSIEVRKNMSEAKIGEKNPMYGKTHSDDTRKKISAGHKGRIVSVETRAKLSIKISVFDIKKNTTTFYDSMSEAARALKIKQYLISKYFNRNQQKPYKGRYIFKKIVK